MRHNTMVVQKVRNIHPQRIITTPIAPKSTPLHRENFEILHGNLVPGILHGNPAVIPLRIRHGIFHRILHGILYGNPTGILLGMLLRIPLGIPLRIHHGILCGNQLGILHGMPLGIPLGILYGNPLGIRPGNPLTLAANVKFATPAAQRKIHWPPTC